MSFNLTELRLDPSDKAWLCLGAGVLLYDLLALPGMTLSEGADKYMQHHPWVSRSVGIALVCHVCNMLPNKADPVHCVFMLGRRWRRIM